MAATGRTNGPGRNVTAASWALNILGVLIGVWEFVEFDPIPTSLIVAVAAPVLAIGLAAAYPGSFALVDGKRGGARSLAALFLVPLGAVVMRAAFTVQLLRFSADLIPAVLGAVAGGAGFWLWWRRLRGNWRLWPLMVVIGVVTACAVFEEIDVRLDDAPSQPFKVPVTGVNKTTSRTKGYITSYYVALPAWGPQHEPNSVRVSADVYDNVRPGQDVCVLLHPGFLGAPWYTVGVCPEPKPAGG